MDQMAKRAAPATGPILATRINPSDQSSIGGFTLIELMVVVAIIAATVTMVIPRIGNRNNQIKATLRELTVLSRQLHMKAKLSGATYRLVIDLKDGAQGKSTQMFWVERSNGETLVRADAEKREEEAEKERKNGGKPPPSDFSVDPSVIKPKELPYGLNFEKVELSRLDEPISRGRAYIHYLPQGLVEESAIHLKSSRGQNWTMSIHPLTGKAELIMDSMSLKDIKQQ